MIGLLFHISCQKEFLCEDCNSNKLPIAIAGADQKIILPSDNIQLDGSASSDPDGTITSYKWVKISGPVSSNIVKPDSSKTLVKTLVMGVYKFELTVTDNGGLSAKDTVQIIVNDPAVNQPPVANAGSDQTITLPNDSALLNGSLSIDPDGTIIACQWTKITGPSSFQILNADSIKTKVNQLIHGIYQFELKVTDNGGLSSKDTVVITVTGECTITNTQLNPFGTLSEARYGMVSASAGNKILFAGGATSNSGSTRVDIYDISTNSWSIAELSIGRDNMTAGAVGNKIFFAGGYSDVNHVSTRVDIYDAGNNTWSTAELSEGRAILASATAGNKILFAGGYKSDGSDRVDIYDNSTNTWSTASLSQARWGLSAISAGNKIYIAGGEARGVGGPGPGGSDIVNTIDIYDALTNTWSVSTLGEAKGYMPGIAVEGKIYWAGGTSSISPLTNDYVFSNKVEIREVNTNISSYVQLCSPIAGYNAIAVQKNNSILFSGIRIYS